MASNANNGRVLWYNPNPTDNVPIQNEELNVFVKLSVETKGKSVIVNSTLQNTGGSGENEISFLSGTKKNEGDDPYLTTDYTNLQSYSLNSDEDYSEMLGIESINIDFNSSMAPMIKIKLIDVRGAAIFGKNGKGKYDFFFQMPYPLFHLELKGYYGYPIEYCLHLIRFNSNFNSQTGNFEIECDFIGYTYALLNDMQMSLLRACENTKIGKKKFQEIKSEYKDPSSILTIDETIKKISSVNDVASTIKKDDAEVKSINKINAIILDCDKLKENIVTLLNEINVARGDSAKIKSDYYMYDVVISNGFILDRKDTELIKKFNESQQKIIDTIKKSLTTDLETIFTNILNNDGSYAKTYFTYGGNIKNNGNIKLDYDNSITDNGDILPTDIDLYTKDKPYYNFIKDIITNELINTTNGYENNTNYFWDFRVAIDKINKFIGELNNEKINKENSIALKTKAQLNKKFGFDSSIRNLFRVLTTSVEVFLSSMMDVSFNAEQSSVRKGELGKLINNFNYVSNSEDKIFPWPEYRAKKEDGSYYEKYLGIDVNKNNVPELLFTEELIDIMITQAKEDKTYLNGGIGDINSVNHSWWPVSVVDSNIPIGTTTGSIFMDKNPYEVILSSPSELYSSYANSSKLLMILRGFLLLGFANKNKISDDLIIVHAKLEAWNLKTAIDNVVSGNNKLTLKQTLNNLTYEIIKDFGVNNSKIFQLESGKFKYSYILSDTGKTFLPINKGFNKLKFYKNGKILDNSSAVELRRSGYIFVGHDDINTLSKNDDGAVYVNIIDADKVEGKNHVPPFGQPSLLRVDYKTNYANKLIDYTNFKDAIKNEDNTTLYVNPLDANKSINVYSDIIYEIPYDETSSNPVGDNLGKTKDNSTTLPLFFADIPNGYSYNTIIVKIDNDVYKKNKYYYSHFIEESDKNKPLKVYTSGRNMYKPNGRIDNGNLLYSSVDGFDYVKRYNNSEAKGYRHKLVEALSNPNIDVWIQPFYGYVFNNNYKHSIFGSAFYYSQTTPEAKALLFLHCFPFQGVVKPNGLEQGDIYKYTMFDKDDNSNILGLKALFTAHNGLIKAPKVWVLFIGGILWRLESSKDPINFSELFLEKGSEPTQKEFLYAYTLFNENPYCGMHFKEKMVGSRYSKIDDVLINLPKQVKNEFINYFKNYVNTNFKNTNQQANEIGGGNITFDEFKTIRENYKNELNQNNNTITKAKAQEIFGDKLNLDSNTFINIGIDIEENGNNFIIETTYEPVKKHVYIQNINPRIWSNTTKTYDPITIEETDFKTYTNTFIDTFKALVGDELKRAPEEIKEIKTELFGTADNDDIRLNVYRTLMAIYQKWISGTQSGGFFSQCMVHPNDSKIANYERNSLTTGSKLIESFRFVDRAYFDIGDKLYINPKTFSDLIIKNKGATFFDVSNRILNDNNFLFLPLPSFVNFNDVSELQKIFEPQMMSESKQGPSFVCIYAGQISNHLELNDDVYKDDGIYINVDKDGNLTGLPEDFAKAKDDNPYEMNVPVFAVNFGQQNQNFFKDIKLDQKEFSETSESLEIIQDLSNAGDKTKVTSIGQNLFNVYQKRSYSCEVEMMGNLAIQPLMYFQLNNIPMFKGLYLIIKVSHTVKANSISTTFKGVRVKKTKTPLIENNTVLLNLTNTSSTNTNATSSGGGSIVVGVNSFGPTACTPWSRTSITPAETKRNIITVIAYLKAQGLNQYQIVGALGNMHHETGGTFNQNAGNPADNNGTTDYGIIQYNSGRWPNDPDCAKGSSDSAASIGCIRCKIGDTIEKQMDYTYNQYNKFKTWLAREEPKNDVYQSAYLFANIVEVCSFCGDEASFKAPNRYDTIDRYNQAQKYFDRFNDPNDELYWDNIQPMVFSNQPANNSTKTNIVIGDSLAPNVLKGISEAGDVTFEILTQLQESGLSAETFLSNKLNNYNTKNDNIKNVVVSLGTNGIYLTTQSTVDKIYAKLKTLFPNAKLMIVKGTYGNLATWSRSLTTVKQQTVNTYYTSFQSKDFFVINPAIGNLKNAHTYAPIYKEIGSNIIVNKK